MLPKPVLEQAQRELIDWQGRGFSVMEVSHRSDAFLEIVEQSEQRLRQLMDIPEHYKIALMQGGATAQFSIVPMNLFSSRKQADYIETGIWSSKAISHGQKLGQINVAASSKKENFTLIPSFTTWQLQTDADYVHYTPNETIHGVEFPFVPDTGDVPLVADFSSSILSQPIDVTQFGVIYAGAQKNIGPSGITLIIIREDLLERVAPEIPEVFTYKTFIKEHSLLNTPPTFAWYLANLTFKWLQDEGGIEEMAKRNQRKSEKLYAAIDASDLYHNPVNPNCRSRMNVPFTIADEALNELFLQQAEEVGLVALRGHRSVGGMRASLYNAMPEAGVDALIAFMHEFEQRNSIT